MWTARRRRPIVVGVRSPVPLLVAACLLAATSTRAQVPVPDSAAASATAERNGSSLGNDGRLGLLVLASGAALLATTASAGALLEALSRNDVNANAPPKNPEFVQVSGFLSVSLLSLSVGALLLGSALLTSDLTD